MTGYTVHTGSNQKFTAGWDQIFQGVGTGKKTAASGKRKAAAAAPKAAQKTGASSKKGAKKSKRTKSGKL